jgi:streptogramin lyase
MCLAASGIVAPSTQARLKVATTQTSVPLRPSGGLTSSPDGSLWLPVQAGNAILRFSSTTGKLIGSINVTDRISGDAEFGGDGRLWYAGDRGGEVERLNPDGSPDGVQVPSLTTATALVAGLAGTRDGATWVSAADTEPNQPQRSSEIVRYARDGSVAQYPLPGDFLPGELVPATDGALWASASTITGGPIIHILPTGVAESYNPGGPRAAYPAQSLTPVSNGGLLAALPESGIVAVRLTSRGAFHEFTVPGLRGNAPTVGSVVASDGHDGIWFAGAIVGGPATFGHISARGVVDYQHELGDFSAITASSGPDGSFFFVTTSGLSRAVHLMHASIVPVPKRCGSVTLKGKWNGRRAAVEVLRGGFSCAVAHAVAIKAASKPFAVGRSLPAPPGWNCKASRQLGATRRGRYVLGCSRSGTSGAIQIGVRYPMG